VQLDSGSASSSFTMGKHNFKQVFKSVNVAMTWPYWKKLTKTFKPDTDDRFFLEFHNKMTQELIVTIDYPTPRMYASGC
jgi:hypothetical protein